MNHLKDNKDIVCTLSYKADIFGRLQVYSTLKGYLQVLTGCEIIDVRIAILVYTALLKYTYTYVHILGYWSCATSYYIYIPIHSTRVKLTLEIIMPI